MVNGHTDYSEFTLPVGVSSRNNMAEGDERSTRDYLLSLRRTCCSRRVVVYLTTVLASLPGGKHQLVKNS
jgi:hypothetical protein